jgi:hypothetical protein
MSDPNFVLLLKQLTVPENLVRQAAETQYGTLKSDANSIPFSLLAVTCDSSVETYVRQLSSVLLRRMLVEDENSIFDAMNHQNQEILLQRLLHSLMNETDQSMKSKMCDIAGELAGYVLERNAWPDICKYAISSAQSANPSEREIGLSLMGYLSNSLVSTKVSTFKQIVHILSVNLQDKVNEGKVILHSLRALNAILSSFTLESELDEFQPLVVYIFGGLNMLLQLNTSGVAVESTLCVYVENLIEIAEEKTSYFTAQTGSCV